MFYKIIDEKTIIKAPIPLKINGKDVFTNSEDIYNNQGYFKCIFAEYPQDGNAYITKYILENNTIVQMWERLEIQEYEI